MKEGDTFNLPVSNFFTADENFYDLLMEDLNNDNYIEFKVKKVLDKNIFKEDYNYGLGIIMSKDFLEEISKNEYIEYKVFK